MRYALLIVLGLAIGIIGTVFAMNALNERNPFPRSLMWTMAHHAGALVQPKSCDAETNRTHLTRLLQASADIDEAFPGMEPAFHDDAAKLRTATQAALDAAPTTCPALAAVVKPIGDACQNCHERYR